MHGAARRNTLGRYIAAVLSVLSSNTDFSYRYTYVGSDWTGTLCWRLIVANIYTVVFQSQSQPLITFPVLAMAKADSPPGANIRGCKVFHFTVSLVPPNPAAQLQILSPHLLCSPHQLSLPPWLFFKKNAETHRVCFRVEDKNDRAHSNCRKRSARLEEKSHRRCHR